MYTYNTNKFLQRMLRRLYEQIEIQCSYTDLYSFPKLNPKICAFNDQVCVCVVYIRVSVCSRVHCVYCTVTYVCLYSCVCVCVCVYARNKLTARALQYQLHGFISSSAISLSLPLRGTNFQQICSFSSYLFSLTFIHNIPHATQYPARTTKYLALSV